MIDVSIIIINYHSTDLLIDCVRSIEEQTKQVNYEIIIVDNDSRPCEFDYLFNLFETRYTIIDSKDNLGFGKANNLGSAYAVGKYLFFLNPDTLLLNNAIKILVDFLDKKTDVGMVGGNLYLPDISPAPSFCKAFDSPENEKKESTWQAIIGSRMRQKYGRKKKVAFENSCNYSEDSQEVAYIIGADMMMPRSLFHELNGFDPDFFMYAEEEELAWRIKKKGYRAVNVPEAKIIHFEGATQTKTNGFNEKQFRMRMNGKMLFFRKCFGYKGFEAFYQYRKLRYKRILIIHRLRGKNTKKTITYKMLTCLDDEYLKTKSVLQRCPGYGRSTQSK